MQQSDVTTLSMNSKEFAHKKLAIFPKQDQKKEEVVSNVIQYVSKWVVKTIYGLYHRKSLNDRWRAIDKNELKGYLNNDQRMYNLWMEKGGNLDVEIIMDPSKRDEIDENGYFTIINLWTGFCIQPNVETNEDQIMTLVRPWVEHIKTTWCDHDDSMTLQILRHFAHIFQTPQTRTEMNIVLRTTNTNEMSEMCKNIVFHQIEQILGSNHYACIEAKGNVTPSNNDNHNWSHSLVLVLVGTFPRPNKIMTIVESDDILTKNKGHKSFRITNIMNIFISSNDYKSQFRFKNIVLNVNDVQHNQKSTSDLEKYFEEIRNVPSDVLLRFLLSFK